MDKERDGDGTTGVEAKVGSGASTGNDRDSTPEDGVPVGLGEDLLNPWVAIGPGTIAAGSGVTPEGRATPEPDRGNSTTAACTAMGTPVSDGLPRLGLSPGTGRLGDGDPLNSAMRSASNRCTASLEGTALPWAVAWLELAAGVALIAAEGARGETPSGGAGFCTTAPGLCTGDPGIGVGVVGPLAIVGTLGIAGALEVDAGAVATVVSAKSPGLAITGRILHRCPPKFTISTWLGANTTLESNSSTTRTSPGSYCETVTWRTGPP